MQVILVFSALSALLCGLKEDSGAEKVRSLMTTLASQYSACKVDEECTFFTFSGGFAINKAGLNYVNDCSKILTKMLRPKCDLDVTPSSKKIGERTLPPGIVPSSVKCQEEKCVGVFESSPKHWFGENSQYISTHRVYPRIDKKCQDIVDHLSLEKK